MVWLDRVALPCVIPIAVGLSRLGVPWSLPILGKTPETCACKPLTGQVSSWLAASLRLRVMPQASTAYRKYRASLARGNALFFHALRRKERDTYFRRAVL